MSSDNDESRYSAKLLFQFRVDLGARTGKRRLCEERIVTFHAQSTQAAISIAKLKGKNAEHDYFNDEGKKVYFEFVGVMEMLELGIECESDEVWYEIKKLVSPMERRDELIPLENELFAPRGTFI